ncbi:MAG: ABC transporter ATP-binding protein [Opitutales bacterium]|nr:ABC transporter ATP-binding protein [Opitutales bacterium]
MNSEENILTSAGAVLKAVDIRKKFKSPDAREIEVLRGVNLEVLRGQSVSLRGESGAGKTTFLNILAGLETPTSGEIYWDGNRVDNLSNSKQASLRGGFMGFVFQNYCLVPELNALENVCLASRILGTFNATLKDRAVELLEKVGLKDRIKHLPSQLSGGEKQRVAVARAIINSPRIILADEPTGNLDETTANDVMEMFLNLCSEQKTALLLITHNPDFAKLTDKRVYLTAGELA